MTRRLTQLALLAALALPFARAVSQSGTRGMQDWTPYLAIGPAIPTADLSVQGNVGANLNAGAEFTFNKWWAVRPEMMFDLIPGRNGASNVSAFGAGASGMFHFVQRGAFRPYAVAYAGIMNLSGGGYGSTDIAVGPGVGGRFRCGVRECFLEARFISVSSPRRDTQLVPLSFGWVF